MLLYCYCHLISCYSPEWFMSLPRYWLDFILNLRVSVSIVYLIPKIMHKLLFFLVVFKIVLIDDWYSSENDASSCQVGCNRKLGIAGLCCLWFIRLILPMQIPISWSISTWFAYVVCSCVVSFLKLIWYAGDCITLLIIFLRSLIIFSFMSSDIYVAEYLVKLTLINLLLYCRSLSIARISSCFLAP